MKLEPGLLARLRQEPAFVNFSWLTADKFIRLGLGVLVGMWVARHLGPRGFGIISYGMAVASLLTVIPSLGLDAIVRRRLVQSPTARGRLLGTTFVLRLLVGVFTYAALLAGAHLLEPDPHARFALAMAGLWLIQQPMLTIDLWHQSQLLSKRTVIAHNLSFTLCSGVRVLLILSDAHLGWFIWVLGLETSLTAALLAATYLRGSNRFAEWRWDGALARGLLRESWPLALATAATMVYVRIDHVMLRSMVGPAETGVYAAATRVMEILHSLPLMLAASMSPGLVQSLSRGPEEYQFQMRRFFNLAAVSAWGAALVCALAAPWAIPLLFGPAFAPAGVILTVLAFSLPLIAMGIARQEYLINAGRQRFQLATTILGASLNVALNAWAIPRWGGLGAAVVTVISHLAADLLTSLVWAPAREVGKWQILALTAFWRPLARPAPAIRPPA